MIDNVVTDNGRARRYPFIKHLICILIKTSVLFIIVVMSRKDAREGGVRQANSSRENGSNHRFGNRD